MTYEDDSGASGWSRRDFLRQIGLGSALGVGALGGLMLPGSAFAACEPPGDTSSPVAWRRDCRPIRARRPASSLSTAELKKLRDAYAAMRALDTSDPSDPRGFTHQANVHCWYCSAGGAAVQVHFSWQFFAWHRAYLYFHERILGKLINDMEFRLPYWSWDNASHRKLPSGYSTPAAASNPLWNSTRAMSATDEVPDEDVGTDVMDAALTAGTFAEFGGTATLSGIPEGAPHGSVHVDVGGNMGTFENAGRDPIFYAHHSNVDKIWSDWNKASSTHTNPTDAAFLNLTWGFFDENKAWRTIKASQLLNHETQLRYVYGPSKFIELLPCLLDWKILRFAWTAERAVAIPPDTLRVLKNVVGKGGRARLQLLQVPVPTDRSAVYRVYATPAAAKEDKGPGSPGYLGAFPAVQNDEEGRHIHTKTRDVTLPVTARALDVLAGAGADFQLALVERQRKRTGDPKVSLVKAKSVHFAVAEVER